MSKSKGNTVDPDMIINKYGADTIRFFILFAAPPEQNLEWSDSAIEGGYKFLKRFWKLSYLIKTSHKNKDTSNDNNILIKTNNTINKVTKDIFERKSYNTAIAAIMELLNFISKNFEAKTMSSLTATKSIETIAKLLYPITPHICYAVLSEFNEDQALNPVWPEIFDTVDENQEVQIIIQINGKMKIIKSIFLISFLTTSFSSCGYQLRGSLDIDELQNIKVIASDSNKIAMLLEQKILSYKNNNSFIDSTYPLVKISNLKSETRQLSVNSSGRVDEYEISKKVDYELMLSETEIIKGSLKASASYDFNESQMQGTREKEIIANNSIDQRLLRKLLLKLKAALKSKTN
jgi:leucyl-tRNA synthetase